MSGKRITFKFGPLDMPPIGGLGRCSEEELQTGVDTNCTNLHEFVLICVIRPCLLHISRFKDSRGVRQECPRSAAKRFYYGFVTWRRMKRLAAAPRAVSSWTCKSV